MPIGTEFWLLMFIMPLIALAIIGFTILAAIRMIRGERKPKKVDRDEETRLIQEIYQGLTRMESRVEALETILWDHEKGKGKTHEPL
jgi:phage shock protein B